MARSEWLEPRAERVFIEARRPGQRRGPWRVLFGVSWTDTAAYAGAAAILAGAALVAGAVPAWRAAQVHPSPALRAE